MQEIKKRRKSEKNWKWEKVLNLKSRKSENVGDWKKVGNQKKQEVGKNRN